MMAIGLLYLWWASQPGQDYLGARMECMLDDDFTAYKASRCGTSLVSIEQTGPLRPAPVIDPDIIVGPDQPWPETGNLVATATMPPDHDASSDPPGGSGALDISGLTAAQRCLSLNVYWEARNQPFAGQLAVAQVTMNRVRDRRYPDDVCEVVYDHKQFSWYWDGKTDRPRDRGAWEAAIAVASAAMSGSGNSELDGVTHYHAVYTQPYWKDHMEHVVTIGDHVFYAEQAEGRTLQAAVRPE